MVEFDVSDGVFYGNNHTFHSFEQNPFMEGGRGNFSIPRTVNSCAYICFVAYVMTAYLWYFMFFFRLKSPREHGKNPISTSAISYGRFMLI